MSRTRNQIPLEFIASSNQSFSELSLIAEFYDPVSLSLREEITSQVQIYDTYECVFNQNHQPLSATPYEDRGEIAHPILRGEKDKYQRDFRFVSWKSFVPVDISVECRKVLSRYKSLLPTPQYDLLIARLGQ